MFGKREPAQTVLILDIENGSVGSALAQLVPGHAPKLLTQSRIAVPLMDTRSAAVLARAVEHALSDSLLTMSEAAARLRYHGHHGRIQKVVAFYAAPWGVPNISAGQPDFVESLTGTLAARAQTMLRNVPVSRHTHMSAAMYGLRSLYPEVEDALLVSVNGEVSELLHIQGGHVVGHATTPTGTGTLLRTLRSHAGMSVPEALSTLRLGQGGEAQSSAAAHFASDFKHAAADLFGGSQAPQSVFVLAHEPASVWLAKALSHHSLAGLFPQGGVVRALRGHTLAPYIEAPGALDVHLGLGALYASASHQ